MQALLQSKEQLEVESSTIVVQPKFLHGGMHLNQSQELLFDVVSIWRITSESISLTD
jgi:hypothetical protein